MRARVSLLVEGSRLEKEAGNKGCLRINSGLVWTAPSHHVLGPFGASISIMSPSPSPSPCFMEVTDQWAQEADSISKLRVFTSVLRLDKSQELSLHRSS